jgi:uncharacterized repeat protein (TIGR01451 family)
MAIFTNQATLSYRNGSVSSNVVTGEIVEALSATKNALTETYSAGDTVTYVVAVFNSGAAAMNNVSLTDDLGAYTFGAGTVVPLTYVTGSTAYYLDGVLQPDPTVESGADLRISGITVPAGGNALIIYQARINEFAPLGVDGEIINTVTVICGNESVTASDTINALASPMLTITKALEPATVTENGQLTYTLTVQNYGNTEAVATDDLAITDTFDPILSNVSVLYNGVAWAEGNEYNYNEATGLFATVPGNITVPAATYSQDAVTGEWNVVPGTSTVVVTGTV